MLHRRPIPRLALLLGALLVGALLVPAAGLAQEDPGELLEEGRRAFQRESFEDARDKLWAYLDATSNLTGAARMPQAEALYYIALMEPDAAVAGRHYQIIVEEFPASPVADGALQRLAVLNLMEGKPDLAIQQFEQLRKNYPVSRYQPEIALWIGQARLAGGDPGAAVQDFEAGFALVKSGELPRQVSMSQRDALAAEYAHWLARAHDEAGDEQTALQYYALLTLDYPDSPQAAEARQVLAVQAGEAPPPAVASAAGERAAEETDLPPVAATPQQNAEPAGDEDTPREEGFEDIAVTDPVAAAPEGVGRGERQPMEAREEGPAPEAIPPEEEPRLEAAPPAAASVPLEPSAETFEPPAKFGPGAGNADLVYLQVGAFTSASRAADLSKRLKEDDFNSSVQIAVVEGRGFYRVRVGPFRISADAARIDRDRRRLTELGYPVEQVPATQ